MKKERKKENTRKRPTFQQLSLLSTKYWSLTFESNPQTVIFLKNYSTRALFRQLHCIVYMKHGLPTLDHLNANWFRAVLQTRSVFAVFSAWRTKHDVFSSSSDDATAERAEQVPTR